MTDKNWDLKTKEMDRLCRLHLDVPYSAVNVQGHYIFVKLGPVFTDGIDDMPLENASSALHVINKAKINTVHCGLVLAMGKYCFEDGVATKWTHGPLCDVGDYVISYIPEFVPTTVNNYAVGYIRDSNILATTTMPHMFGQYSIGRFPREALKSNKCIFKRSWLDNLGIKCSSNNIRFMEDIDPEEDAR